MGKVFDALIDGAIRYRLLVLLFALVLAVIGGFSAARAPLDVLPDFMPPRVVVQTEAPGMGTPEVEELVTRPLERALLGTPLVTSVRSVSSPGLSVVTLLFEDDVEIYRARQLVTERVQLAAGKLPAVVAAPQLAPISAPIGALLKLCMTSADPDAKQAGRAMRRFADYTLRPRLLAISGVAQVTAHGGDVERVEVRPDPARMIALGISLAEVQAAVRASQTLAGAGFVEAPGARLDVKVEARLDMENVIAVLGEAPLAVRDGAPLRLADVAEVVRGDEPPVGLALYNGEPAVYVQVTKLPWADTPTVTHEVERAIEALRPDLPKGAVLQPPVFRQASFVETSVWSVGRAMLLGAVLVVVVLVAFLRSPRLAAISLTAIPLSLLGAVAVLVATGASLNGMTLGGLAIAVGEVVDDAIVDVENVWRRLRENAAQPSPRPPLEVIRDASREIRGSVVYATVIVVLVLVPVLLLGGVAGRIFAPLAQAYMLAIGASLAVALTVTPALCALLLPKIATKEARPTRFALWLLERYRSLLARVVKHPRRVFAFTAIFVLGGAAILPFLGGGFLPEFHEGSLIAHVNAAPGTSLAEAGRLAARVSAEAADLAPQVAARAGRAELDEDAAPVHRIEMDFVLGPKAVEREWDDNVLDVAKRIGRVPGLGFVVEGFLGERVHEVLSGETAPIVVKVFGPDLGELRRLAAEVGRAMEQTPGIRAPNVEPQLDVADLRIVPDRVALARFGVSPQALLDAVRAWRQGAAATQLLEPSGQTIDVVIAGPLVFRDEAALSMLPVQTAGGAWVRLGALARVERGAAPATLSHDGGERRISIGANAASVNVSGAAADLEARIHRDLVLPPGYRVEIGGEAVARGQAALRLLLVGAAVLVGIFALLTIAFRSSRDAGIVLLNFPLGLVGGVIAALLTPEGLSVAGFVGFVTLFGIIARNGIMLVSHKRQLDEERPNTDPIARVLLAAEERLLPILMTAATAGLGLLPLALSFEAAGSELEAPMALIVCGGLVTSTVLNMLVLPTVYVWFARRGRVGLHESSAR